MTVTITLKKSSVANKRPLASSLVPGELALNANTLSTGLFFLDCASNVVKVGPAAVGPSAPNITAVGSPGNSVGETWYDTTNSALFVWDGFAWRASGGGTGTVTQITAGTGLTGDVITTSGTIALADTAVVPGSYTNSSFSVDAQGRLTAASSGTAPVTSVTAGAGLTGGTITTSGTIALATSGVSAGSYNLSNITVDTYGRVTTAASGSVTGAVPISIDNTDPANPVVTTSVATNKLLGRSTAGTGVAEEITIGTNLTLAGGTLNASGTAVTYATTSAEILGVATTATATNGSTSIVVASNTGISVTDNVFGLGIPFGTSVTSIAGTTIGLSTAIKAKLTADALSFYPGTKVLTPSFGIKGWVKYPGPAAAIVTTTFAGGASTVSRTSPSTTCTVTCASPHGLITGNIVSAASGVTATQYAVTVTSSTTFTFTTAATTPLSAVPITFYEKDIICSGGIISSVAPLSTGSLDVYLNFNTAMPDDNYAVIGSGVATNTLIVPYQNSNVGLQGTGLTSARVNSPGNVYNIFQILR